MNELSWLEINLSRLEHNLAWWRSLLGSDGAPRVTSSSPCICAVVKANAYGLGAAPIAQRLADAGVDMLAVYSPAQAEELVEARIRTPILVLMPTRELEQTDAVRQAVAEGRMHLAINDLEQLEMIAGLGRRLDCPLPVHLHLDTGMSRAGLNETQFTTALTNLADRPHLKLAGIYSHFATVDSDPAFAYEQNDRLDRALTSNRHLIGPDVIIHTAATFGALRDRRFHRGMVRIGLGLYGHGIDMLTHGPVLPAADRPQPAIRWLARIIHVQQYPSGACVSYGCTHRLARPSILGVVPVGYADGFPLAISNKAAIRVLPNGHPAATVPLLGVVSMDQIVIDLTDVPNAANARGAIVELIASDPASPCSLVKVAAAAQTSPYEILCRLSPRLPRRYVSIETTKSPLAERMQSEISLPR